jgi:DNA polymerase III delta prime subunit
MTKPVHWLVDAAHHAYPDTEIPESISMAPDLADAWQQVCGLFHIDTHALAVLVGQAHGVQPGDIAQFQSGDGSCLPERLCRQMHLVPLWAEKDAVCVAVSDPRLTHDERKKISFAARRQVQWVVLAPEDIDTCQTRLFAVTGQDNHVKTKLIDLLAADSGAESNNVKLVGTIFRTAIDRNASDIHIHPFVGGGAIRFRVDGVMRRIATLPIESLHAIARYLKTHAGLELNPLKPQDGRLRLKYGRREIDVRLSVLPAYDGDRIVCRLLDQSRNFSLQHSRFSVADQQALHRLTGQTSGIVLLTGPTGSGKTSTLYALLSELNSVDVNIMTIEDPVEYVLPGISQVQVNEKQGLSFADTLRSILRQDPDVVLVGEIRDEETARIALQAALTGHLVLSTLHTNDALGAIARLLDLKLDASVVADALVGVVSQRLVRGLCESCRLPRPQALLPMEQEFARITGELPAYRPVGCEACGYTGYRGRLPVIEYIETTDALRQSLIDGGYSLATLKDAVQGHRRSMAMSAKDWIVAGKTTPFEVQKVLGMKFWSELALEHEKVTGDVFFDAGTQTQADRRMNVLLLSSDAQLAACWRVALPYGVEMVPDAAAAVQHMVQQGSVIALAIDSALCLGSPEGWLIELRTALVSSGLPALFVLREPAGDLQALLERFGAVNIPYEEAQTGAISATVNLLLKGVS